MTAWAIERIKSNGASYKPRRKFVRLDIDAERILEGNLIEMVLSHPAAEFGLKLCREWNPMDTFRIVEFESKEPTP